MKQPWTDEFRARGNPRRYLLSGIPPTLWERARKKAREEHVSMRAKILKLLDEWSRQPTDTFGT